MIKAIIFDFDGVILDSTEIKTSGFINIFKKDYSEYLPEILKHHHNHLGISRYNKIKYYYEKILNKKLSKKQLKNKVNLFSNLCLHKIIKCKFIPGSHNFIIKNFDKYKFFISSGTPTLELRYICKKRNLSKYFSEIYGSPLKKDTHIKRIMKKYNFKSKEIVFIGDGHSDYVAAKKNKLHFVGINFKKNLNINNILRIDD